MTLTGMFVGLVVPDHATRAGAEETVMSGIMPRNTANNGPFQAPLGRGRR